MFKAVLYLRSASFKASKKEARVGRRGKLEKVEFVYF